MTGTAWCPDHNRRESIDDEFPDNDARGRDLWVAVLSCGATVGTYGPGGRR